MTAALQAQVAQQQPPAQPQPQAQRRVTRGLRRAQHENDEHHRRDLVTALHIMHRYAALRGAEAPGRSGFVPQPGHKEFWLTAYFVMPVIRNSVRFRFTQTALGCLN